MRKLVLSTTTTTTEFQTAIDDAATQLNCDKNCISQCTTFMMTLDTKARCLDRCLCFESPAEKFERIQAQHQMMGTVGTIGTINYPQAATTTTTTTIGNNAFATA
jgi:hypothetical protein